MQPRRDDIDLGFNASETMGSLSTQGQARCMVAFMKVAEIAETQGILAVEMMGFNTGCHSLV